MNNPIYDFQFSFQFNLHKSLIPVGIGDDDYDRLRYVYGVQKEILMQEVHAIDRSNYQSAKELSSRIDCSSLSRKGAIKIAFLGDSITSDRQSYFNIIRTALEDFKNIVLYDCSISGQKSGDLFTAMYPNYYELQPNIAHIMIGSNDFHRLIKPDGPFDTSPAEYEKNIDFIVSAFAANGTKVIITTIPPFSKEKATASFSRHQRLSLETDRLTFNAILKKVADKHGACYNAMDDKYAPYTRDELTLPDGVHLSGIGQQLLAQSILQAVLKQVETT